MTTIAFKDGIVAADSGCCVGGTRAGTVNKLSQNKAGDIAAASGSAAYLFAFLKWFQAHEKGSPPEARSSTDTFDRGVIFRKSGVIEVFEDFGKHTLQSEFYATGSGRPEAMGAMAAGATAAQAIEIASRLDVYTFGPVITLSHRKSK